jgi:carbon-monoxide dehydrogenase medium subunit
VGVAAIVRRTNGGVESASIGLVSMGATPLRAEAAEAALASGASVGDAALLLAAGTEPPADQAGSSAYRAHLVTVLGRRALEEALAR